jgi:CheY-like chemotaxis protein
MHGGTVHVASEGEQQGATFRVHLPLMIVSPERFTSPREHPLVEGGPRKVATPNLEGVRLVAVDDDRDALGLIREILSIAGADVHTADSGQSALDLMHDVHPHVLLADIGMPLMDGFELIGKVRSSKDPAVRAVEAAALTAYARSEDRAKALRSGFQIHLSKPIDPNELMAAIAALARRHSAKS